MGSFGRLVASSLTTYHAFETCCRLIHLHNSGSHLSLTEAGDEVWFCHSEFHSPKIGRRQKEQYVVMRMIDHVRLAAGPSWRPAKVCLQTRKAPERELREALGDPEIRIGQKFTGIAFPRALLAQPLRQRATPSRDREEDAEALLRHTAPAASFVGTLRQLAGTLLKERPPQIETMAEITGLSVRSLQRRLAENGLSHSQLVDQARYQAATRLLEDADIRMTDIAMELNYSDSANFTRAFKRWAGVTPREYRSHQQMR
jgi:AraC-like DNA-binding protein